MLSVERQRYSRSQAARQVRAAQATVVEQGKHAAQIHDRAQLEQIEGRDPVGVDALLHAQVHRLARGVEATQEVMGVVEGRDRSFDGDPQPCLLEGFTHTGYIRSLVLPYRTPWQAPLSPSPTIKSAADKQNLLLMLYQSPGRTHDSFSLAKDMEDGSASGGARMEVTMF